MITFTDEVVVRLRYVCSDTLVIAVVTASMWVGGLRASLPGENALCLKEDLSRRYDIILNFLDGGHGAFIDLHNMKSVEVSSVRLLAKP